MKKYINLALMLLFCNAAAQAQTIKRLAPVRQLKIQALNLTGKSTAQIKQMAQYQSADPFQRSLFLSGSKKSAITRPAQGSASNLSITSADGKTTKKITKVIPVDKIKEEELPGTPTTSTTTKPDGSKIECTTKKIRMEAGYSDNNLLSPMEEVMWVGNILDGNSILNGGYASLNTLSDADRNPYPVSIDLNALGTQSLIATVGTSGTFGRGQYNNAINTIKNQGITLEQTGEGGFSYSEVYSSSQVYANLSAGLSVTPVNLTSDIGLAASASTTKTSYLVQFYEIWYTSTLDMNTWNLVKDISKINNEALVVSSIKYGRMGTFMFETSTDMDSLQAYLDIAFNVDPSVAVRTVNRAGFSNVHRNTSIKSYVNGANGVPQSLEDFLRFVDEKKWTAASPAQPIGYTLRFVKDGQIANVLTTTEFNHRSCDIIPPPGKTNIRFSVSKIEAVKDIEAWGEDICGKISLYAYYLDANNREHEIGKKTIWNVGCSPSSWMAGVDADDPVDINKQADFLFEGDQVKTAYLRVTLDIRDGLEGKNQMGLNEWNLTSQANRNRGYVQYKIFKEDYSIHNLKPDDDVAIRGNSVTMQELGGTPKVKVSFYLTKSEIK